jgi:hypothetical protein
MRALLMLTTALAVCAATTPATAQAPSAATEDVLTWEELPAAVRQRYEAPTSAPLAAQAVLHVQDAVVPDIEFRLVDHGAVLFEQFIRPGGLARITRPVRNANKYGPMGAVLWPGIGPDGQYWCWKRAGPLSPVIRNNIYCYLDNDGDGRPSG